MQMRSMAVSGVVAASFILGAAIAAAPAQDRNEALYTAARNRMVDEEIVAAGVSNPRVIESIRNTRRHEFVPPEQRRFAYYDMALPIGSRQTISPPFIVAHMTEQIDPQPEDNVLEIGTGSGYQAAVLSPLVRDVYTIEIVEPLGQRAQATLNRLGYENVHTKIGDGYQGWPEHAPFDKIIVTCSPEDVPAPLVEQLKEGGRMIIPLGERYQQTLYLYTKVDGKLRIDSYSPTLFVPMTGAAEEKRDVLPDPSRPQIVNGDFETVNDAGKIASWHYQRQSDPVTSGEAREGERFARFTNDVPGRGSQALQGFAVDGREVKSLELSTWVRTNGVAAGAKPDERPAIYISFYDSRRASVGDIGIGPWVGSHDWKHFRRRIRVPVEAREAIVRIGLFGAVGEIDFDDVIVRRWGEGESETDAEATE
ncbi:MAG: protein-L-isoaspartate(D-aspartate) O-methyltransferase [Planctomycetales bacterium]|nr:protein-L-isoaspartate(D-aspartate) O-methyltransferase [Planctomycetales bacterium]